MKTEYYTFTTWDNNAMAAGFDGSLGGGRQAAMIRQSEQRFCREDEKVIDLTAWRAANLDLLEAEDEAEEPCGACEAQEEPELEVPAPRPRKSRRAMITAELVSTLSVAAAALALVVRVLTF